ncbi:MAG TPA: hypothetical protein VEU33_28955 [Archangium sp.]|nr:hypothetical protein [Archangium sp.]
MKTSTAIGLGVLSLAVVGGTVGTVIVVQKGNASAKAREQANALELERLKQQAAPKVTQVAAPAAKRPAGINLGNVAKDALGFLGDVKGLVGGFKDLLKF